MASVSDIARPYAIAAFKQAQQEGRLGEWSGMLQLLETIVSDPTTLGLIANPKVNNEQLGSLIIDVGGDGLSQSGQNFVRVLAENGRLNALPAIAQVFAEERSKAEGRSEVEVTSAYELSAEQQQNIASTMSTRLGTEVTLSVSVDNSLIGGVVIRAGDLVIDASLRGRLNQLASGLS